MKTIDRTEKREHTTYRNHYGEQRDQIEVTKYIHHVDGDNYETPGNIRVLFTVWDFGSKYMAYAEAFRRDDVEPFFKGNSLWHHSSMTMPEIDKLIDSIIGMETLRRNFA